MSQQRLIKSPKKRRLAPPSPQSVPARSFQGKSSSPILQLQRTLGNRRVAQLIRARRLTPQGKIIGLQRKLTVGAADDHYEQEADHIARRVMSMPDAGSANSMRRAALPEEAEKTAEEGKDKILQTQPLGASITQLEQPRMEEKKPEDKEMLLQAKFGEMSGESVRRQAVPEEEEAEPIQASAAGSWAESFEAGGDVESRLNQSKGGGSPLPDSVRTFMEPRFGMDFSQVRAHTGSEAIQMNRDVGARAFTHGTDIYYGAGHSPTNLELTAHELTHVVQQTGGAPLQPKKMAETRPAEMASTNANPSMQRTCPVCGADKERKEAGLRASRFPGGVQAKRTADAASSENVAQRSPVRERTNGSVVQGAWGLTAHSAVSGTPLNIQRYAGQATEHTGTAPASVDRVLASPGRPLELELRADMGQRFGYDFSQVRMHSGDAQKVNRSSTQVPTIQRLGEREGGPILSCPPLPDPDGDWAQERWLCEMRQEPLYSNKRLLAPGASGRSVELVHQVLQHWLCDMSKTEPPKHTLPDPTSSVFTVQSSAVMLDFQRFSHALMKEGIVGPETISLLDGYVGGPDVPPVDCGIPKPEPEQPHGCGPECYDIFGKLLPQDELPDSCDILCTDKPRPKRKRGPDLMDDKTQEWEAKIDGMATLCTPTAVAACASVGTVFIRSKSELDGKGRLFMEFIYRGEGVGGGCPAGVSYGSDWEPFTTTKEVGISDFAGYALHGAASAGAHLGIFLDSLEMHGPISKGANIVIVEWVGISGGVGCGGNIDVEGRLHVGHRPRRLK